MANSKTWSKERTTRQSWNTWYQKVKKCSKDDMEHVKNDTGATLKWHPLAYFRKTWAKINKPIQQQIKSHGIKEFKRS